MKLYKASDVYNKRSNYLASDWFWVDCIGPDCCILDTCHSQNIYSIKLFQMGAQACALPLFCNRTLEINPMTLKLNSDLDSLKMYHHTKNEVAS